MNSKKRKAFRKALPLYIMVMPGFLYLLINNYIPMFGIVIAFKNLNFAKGILKSDWAGFSNFEYLFKAPDALLVTRNTIFLQCGIHCGQYLYGDFDCHSSE